MSPERISNLERSAYIGPFSYTFSHINKTGNPVTGSGSSKECFQFESSIPVLKMGIGSNSVSIEPKTGS